MAHCYYCQVKIRIFSKLCGDCAQLVTVLKALQTEGTFGYNALLDALIATGVAQAKIEKFLDADPDGRGSLNDQITARMTNEVMKSMGMPSTMTGTDVKKVRDDVAAGRSLLEQPDVVAHPKAEKE